MVTTKVLISAKRLLDKHFIVISTGLKVIGFHGYIFCQSVTVESLNSDHPKLQEQAYWEVAAIGRWPLLRSGRYWKVAAIGRWPLLELRLYLQIG